MSKLYNYLKFPFDICDMQGIVEKYTKNIDNPKLRGSWSLPKEGTLNDDIFKVLEEKGCELAWIELMYTPPNVSRNWHIDPDENDSISNVCKINIIFCEEDNHYCQLGVTKNSDHDIKLDYTNVNGSLQKNFMYISFKDDEIDVIDSITIKNPILINVGVPHRVVNNTNSSRWCLCLVLRKNGKRILFEEALDIFKEYLIE